MAPRGSATPTQVGQVTHNRCLLLIFYSSKVCFTVTINKDGDAVIAIFFDGTLVQLCPMRGR